MYSHGMKILAALIDYDNENSMALSKRYIFDCINPTKLCLFKEYTYL